ATDAGHGFVVEAGDLIARNRAGKAVLTVPAGAQVLPPQLVHDRGSDQVAAVTSGGRLLLFPLRELPLLARGKGVRIIGLRAGAKGARGERLAAVAVLPAGAHLKVHAGKHFRHFKPAELAPFEGERARRGAALPRGFQGVTSLEVVT
ncbi:MAG TPA: DNA gyrase C-terminal beta-propeller domain-containing protein, partial [Thermoanaerobaculia bacterium]|nr:DNA gyrase C-terminal beta-propeller domain-containing protein [Thermoanaerobaculia bacterium]